MRDLFTRSATGSDSSLDRTISCALQLADDFQLSDAKELFQKLLNRKDSVRIHLSYIRFLTDFESFDAASEYAEIVESQLSPVTHSPADLAEFYNVLASVYRKTGLYSLARRSQQLAIQHDLALNQWEGLSFRTLLGQAHDLCLQNAFTSAKYLLISLRKRSDEIGMQARLLLAEIYLSEEETVAAKIILDEILDRCDCVQLKVETLRLMSTTCLQDKEYSVAEQYLNTAIALARNSARCVKQLPSLQKQRSKLKQQLLVCTQNCFWN